MKTLYLINNNLLSNNVSFDRDLNIERKKEVRPLSSDGVKLALKINIGEIDNIYSSSYTSCVETAKFVAEKKNKNVFITEDLNDCLVGDLKNQSLKMLSFFQEHDYDFKQPGGESLNQCQNRISKAIEKIKDNCDSAAVFLPRRALFSYLIKYTTQGFNLDDRLVLTFNDEVLMENTEEDIEVFKVIFDGDEVEIFSLS